MLIPPFPFPVPITSALPGGRTVSAAQAAHHEKRLSPQLRSSSPRIAGAWLVGGTAGLWAAPRVCHGMGQLGGNCPGQVRTSQLPRKTDLLQVSPLEPLWQRCCFLYYTVMHVQRENGSSCCPETLTPAFSSFPGLSLGCVWGLCVCLLSSRSIFNILQSKGSKVMPLQSTQSSFCIHKYVIFIVQRPTL